MSREYACQICHHVLNRFADGNGFVTYEHPTILGPADHPPAPVRSDRLEYVHRCCDFCGAGPDPLLAIYETPPIAAAALDDQHVIRHEFGVRWSACVSCDADIDAGRHDALAERVAAFVPADPLAVAAIRHLHDVVLAHRLPGRTLLLDELPTAAIVPRQLPKARDRLVTLLAGPDSIGIGTADRRPLTDRLPEATLYFVDRDYTQLATTAAAALPPTALTGPHLPAGAGVLAWDGPA
ncbi:MAG: hypothetical protein HOV79_32305, partial [Hamadaea sp.]|nr:hypothetical protein [Hamadaea sp.]